MMRRLPDHVRAELHRVDEDLPPTLNVAGVVLCRIGSAGDEGYVGALSDRSKAKYFVVRDDVGWAASLDIGEREVVLQKASTAVAAAKALDAEMRRGGLRLASELRRAR
jgi:hypothetical protein